MKRYIAIQKQISVIGACINNLYVNQYKAKLQSIAEIKLNKTKEEKS